MPLQKKTKAKEKLDKSNSNKRILRTRVIEKPKERSKKILSSKKKSNKTTTNATTNKQRGENESNKKISKIREEELVQKSSSSSYALRGNSLIRTSKTKKRKDLKKVSKSNNKNSEEDESDSNNDGDDDDEEEDVVERVLTRSKKPKSVELSTKNNPKTKKVQKLSSNKKIKITNEKRNDQSSDDDDDDEQTSVSSEEMKEKKNNAITTTTTSNRESNATKTKSVASKSSVMATRNSKSHQQKEQILLRKDQKQQQWKCEKCRQSYRTESGYYNHIPVCPSYSSSTSSNHSDSEYSHGEEEEEDSLINNISDDVKGSSRPEYEENVIFSDDDDELKEIMNAKVDSSTTIIQTSNCVKSQKENYDVANNTSAATTTTILTNENKQSTNLEYSSTPNVISTNTAELSAKLTLLDNMDPSIKIEKTFSEPLKTNDSNNDQNVSNNSNTTNKPVNSLVASVERFFSSASTTTTSSTPISTSSINESDNKVLRLDNFIKQPSLFVSQSLPNMCSVNNVTDTVTSTKCAKYSNLKSLNNPKMATSKSKKLVTNKKTTCQVESQSSEDVKKKVRKNKKSKTEINSSSSSSSRNSKDKGVKMKSTSCQSTDTGTPIVLLSKTSSSIGTGTTKNTINSPSSFSSIDPYQNNGRKSSSSSNNNNNASTTKDNISKHTDYIHEGQQTEQLTNKNANNIQHINHINPLLNEMTSLPHHRHQQQQHHPITSHGLLSPQPHYPSSNSIISPYSSPSLSSTATTGSIKTNTPYTSPHIGSPNSNHRNNDSFSDAFNQLVSNSPKLNLQKSLLSPLPQHHHTLPPPQSSTSSASSNYEGETITLQDDNGQIHHIPVPSIQQQLQQSAAAAATAAHLQRLTQNHNPYTSSPYFNNLNWSLQQQALMHQQQQQFHQPLGFVTGLQHLQQQQQQHLFQQNLIRLPPHSNFTMMQQQQQQLHHHQYPIVSSHLQVNAMAFQQPTYIDQPLSSSSSINHNNSPYLILQPGTTNTNSNQHHQFPTISNRLSSTPIYNINNNGLPSVLPSDAQKLYMPQQHPTATNTTNYFENHQHHHHQELFDTKPIPLPFSFISGSGISASSIIQQQQQQDRINNSLFLTPQNPITSNLHTSPSKISMLAPNSNTHSKTSNNSAGVAQPCPCDLCLERIRNGGETKSKSSTEPTYVTHNKKLQQQYNKNVWNNSSHPVPSSSTTISKHSSSSSKDVENKKSSGKGSKKQSNRSSNNGTTNLKKILPALKSTVSTATDSFQTVGFSSKHVSLSLPIEKNQNSVDHKNSKNHNPVSASITTTNGINNTSNNNNNNIAVVRPMEHPLQKLAEKFGDLNSTVSPSSIKLSQPSDNNGDNKDNSCGSKLGEDNQRNHMSSSCHYVNSENHHLTNITTSSHDKIEDQAKINRKYKLAVSQPRKSKLNESESNSSTIPIKRSKHAKDKIAHNEDSQIHKREKDGKSKIKITLRRKEGGNSYSIGDVTTGTIDTKCTTMRSLKIKAKVTNGQGQGQSSDVVVVPVIHTVPIPFETGSNRTIPVGEEESVNIMDPLVLKKKKKDSAEDESDTTKSSKKTHRVVVVYEVKHAENTIFRSSNVHSIWDFIFETVQGQKTFKSSFPPLSYPGTNIYRDDKNLETLKLKGEKSSDQSDYNELALTHRAVQFLLSQLPSPNNNKLSTTKSKNKHSNNNETQSSEVPVAKCARIQGFQGRKPFDMFGWLASKHRTLPAIEGPNDNGKVVDLPVALRYKPLKREKSCLLGVYFSTIHGRGLFTRRDIEQGEVIIEYAGEIIRSILCDIREKHYESKGYGCYFFTIDDNLVVDATIHGNAARFINHSCDPNCRSKIDYVQGKKRILIVSLRKILGGEELTYDYKFAKEEKDKKIPCHCGTKKCRKYLN